MAYLKIEENEVEAVKLWKSLAGQHAEARAPEAMSMYAIMHRATLVEDPHEECCWDAPHGDCPNPAVYCRDHAHLEVGPLRSLETRWLAEASNYRLCGMPNKADALESRAYELRRAIRNACGDEPSAERIALKAVARDNERLRAQLATEQWYPGAPTEQGWYWLRCYGATKLGSVHDSVSGMWVSWAGGGGQGLGELQVEAHAEVAEPPFNEGIRRGASQVALLRALPLPREVERDFLSAGYLHAWIIDRAEQYDNDSPSRAALEELAGRVRRREHIDAARSGELDDLVKSQGAF